MDGRATGSRGSDESPDPRDREGGGREQECSSAVELLGPDRPPPPGVPRTHVSRKTEVARPPDTGPAFWANGVGCSVERVPGLPRGTKTRSKSANLAAPAVLNSRGSPAPRWRADSRRSGPVTAPTSSQLDPQGEGESRRPMKTTW